MRKTKSLIFSLLISGSILGALYITPINLEKSNKTENLLSSNNEEFPEDIDTLENKVEVEMAPIVEPPIETTPEVNTNPIVEQPKTEEKAIVAKPEEPKKKEEPKKPTEEPKKDDKKSALKKTEEELKKQPIKESKIGVDRKLSAGIPGTMNYKGKLPTHNVKEKGSITISYTVDKNGNVISAYRTAGLRDKNTINNAITMVKKYVKAEKGKANSTGSYTINF